MIFVSKMVGDLSQMYLFRTLGLYVQFKHQGKVNVLLVSSTRHSSFRVTIDLLSALNVFSPLKHFVLGRS